MFFLKIEILESAKHNNEYLTDNIQGSLQLM